MVWLVKSGFNSEQVSFKKHMYTMYIEKYILVLKKVVLIVDSEDGLNIEWS